MKKETIIAIFLGIMLGVFGAMFVVLKNNQNKLEKNKPIAGQVNITPIAAAKKTSNFQTLEITEPTDGMIVNEKTIVLKGKVNKNSLIVIGSAVKDMAFKNEKEDFQTSFPLAFGENIIHFTVYPEDKNLSSSQTEIKVYYLDEQ